MPDYAYTYTTSDFISVSVEGIDLDALNDSIWSNVNIISLYLLFVYDEDDNNLGNFTYSFRFKTELTINEQTELDTVISSHTGNPPGLTDLEKAIEDAKNSIDTAAGTARSRYITVSPGQDAVYVGKGKEAQAYIDAGYPVDLTGYPFVTAEKNAKGITPTAAADTISAIAVGWTGLAASIEEIRLGYKEQIGAETDIDIIMALCGKCIAILNSV